MTEKLTNDGVRKALEKAGVTTESVTHDELVLLHKILEKKLAESGCFRQTYRMNELTDDKYMTCRADYFKEREAVSFNRDGFIGFAGWASTENVQPILKGVLEWIQVIA